jgi:hypothetical protein
VRQALERAVGTVVGLGFGRIRVPKRPNRSCSGARRQIRTPTSSPTVVVSAGAGTTIAHGRNRCLAPTRPALRVHLPEPTVMQHIDIAIRTSVRPAHTQYRRGIPSRVVDSAAAPCPPDGADHQPHMTLGSATIAPILTSDRVMRGRTRPRTACSSGARRLGRHTVAWTGAAPPRSVWRQAPERAVGTLVEV